MRLSSEEVALLKNELHKLSTEAKLYLFGSRIDDRKRGGDIDLLILSDKLQKRELRQLRVAFCKRFGEQKIDIVLDKHKPMKPFVKFVLQKAVEL